MKCKETMQTTSNSNVYKKAYKIYLEYTGKIRCSRCPYHNGENSSNSYYNLKNWKKYRKHQWRFK